MRVRILMLTKGSFHRVTNGRDRHIYELSRELCNRGHEVHLLAADHSAHAIIHDGVVVQPITPMLKSSDYLVNFHHTTLAMIEHALLLSKQLTFDVIHCHDAEMSLAGNLIGKVLDIPHIASVHYLYALHPRPSDRYIAQFESHVYTSSRKVIAVSRSIAEDVKRLYGVDAQVIHNGINTNSFTNVHGRIQTLIGQEIKRKYEQHEIVLYVGRLEPEKGAMQLVAAVPGIVRDHSSVRIIIVGTGAERDLLERLCYESGVSSYVDFLGYVGDQDALRDIYNLATITVIPSLYEPFGLVPLESLSCGTPVIVSNIGGPKEYLTHMKEALFVKPGSPAEISAAVSYLLQNPAIRSKLSRNGMDLAALLSWESVAKSVEEVYMSVSKSISIKAIG